MCNWKCTPQTKSLVKFVEKLLEILFFSICGLCSGQGRRNSIFEWGDIQRRGKFTFLGLQGDLPIPSLSGTSWSPHKENPDEGAWSVYCDDFEKRVFSLKSNTFTAFKVKHEKEVPNILMVFNLLKIIHPFQVKKHLRT